MRQKSGFTLVELVVVVAIIAILAALAVPRYLDMQAAARGGKLVADIYTCEDAVNVYYARNNRFPDDQEELVGTLLAAWPTPPAGRALLTKSSGEQLELFVEAAAYEYVVQPSGAELNTRVGRVTLGGQTLDEILGSTATSLTL